MREISRTVSLRKSMVTRENIVLVGFMGSGKSAVGRHVAKRLRFQFVDTDQLIIDRAGIPIAAIFAEHGEEYFRDLELRRRVLLGLNKGESLHSLARKVFFGSLGEVRDRTYEDQLNAAS